MHPRPSNAPADRSWLLVSLAAVVVCAGGLAVRALRSAGPSPAQGALPGLDEEVVRLGDRVVAAIEQSRPQGRESSPSSAGDLIRRAEALQARLAAFEQSLEIEVWLAVRGAHRKHTVLDYIYSADYFVSRLTDPASSAERPGLLLCLSQLPGSQVTFDGPLTDLWIEAIMTSALEEDQLRLVAVPRGMARSETALTGILHFARPGNPERVRAAALERLEDYVGHPRADHALRAARLDPSSSVRQQAEQVLKRLPEGEA